MLDASQLSDVTYGTSPTSQEPLLRGGRSSDGRKRLVKWCVPPICGGMEGGNKRVSSVILVEVLLNERLDIGGRRGKGEWKVVEGGEKG